MSGCASSRAEAAEEPQRLQQLLLYAFPGAEALYWRTTSDRHPSEDGAPAVPAHATLSLNTYLNSFYENHWRRLASLGSLILETVTSGPCRIRIVRRGSGHGSEVLAESVVRGTCARSRLAASLGDRPVDDTVIHAEIEALDAPAMLHDGAWLTNDRPRNPVRLAIVICSYRREEMLLDTLSALESAVARNPDIQELLVVRQGGQDLSAYPSYAQLRAEDMFDGKLRVIEQRNFGGSGGFARGVLECLETDATDILLLDDDIRIEASLLERLTALLARIKEPTTIGGQMLELEQPCRLHASCETIDFDTLQLRNADEGADLATAPLDVLFGQVEPGGYNAWWFCCIPASVWRAQGLPLPMFVRHDDVEFGVRTREAGLTAAIIPGLFVWHEAFDRKVTPLYVYYDRRNLLICASLHSPARPVRWALRHWRETWQALRKRRYEYCWALCRAADDFCQGPAIVFAHLPERHEQFKTEHARLALLTMTGHRLRRGGDNIRTMPLTRDGTRTRSAVLNKTDRQLALMIVRTTLTLVFEARASARAYRSMASAYSSETYWRDLLQIGPVPERLR